MTDYNSLDAAILEAIRDGSKTASSINQRVFNIAVAVTKLNSWGQRTEWQTVSSRMQCMRKAGRIRYSSKSGWEISE